MKIFWPTYGGIHVLMAIAMYREFEKRNDECVILATPPAFSALENSGVPYRRMQDYLFLFGADERREIERLGADLAAGNHNPNIGFTKDDTESFFGVCMYCLVRQHGEERARALFERDNRKAFLPVEALRRILKYVKPDAVCVSCAAPLEKAAALVARENGIHTFYTLSTPQLPSSLVGDYYFLINRDTYDLFLESGLEKEKLYVTGQPAFSCYSELRHDECKRRLCNDLNLDPEKALVSWMGQDSDDYDWKIYVELCRQAQRFPDWNFIAKMHPASQDPTYFDIPGVNRPGNMVLLQHYDTKTVLSASDLVIVVLSTTGFEALLLDRPLLVVNITGKTLPIRYYEKGAALYLDNFEDFSLLLQKGLFDENTKRALKEKRKLYSSSPAASVQVADLIHELY